MNDVVLGVSEALGLINQSLEEAFPFIIIEGEVASYKVNQNKFIFFDIKDESSTLSCFMMLFKASFPIEDGMKVKIIAQPKLTNWGRFSLTVDQVTPVGKGSLQKSFQLLKAKLEQEGLFDKSRKRILPKIPQRIGVVSSAQAAGYKDFLKILQNRWGGLEVVLVPVTVQGETAPDQIMAALIQLNELVTPLDAIAVIRGGGSADDLAAFNHEGVVRAVAQSRTPVISGIGHEVDTSLVDLVADVRAATPSNAAEILVPDKQVVVASTHTIVKNINTLIASAIQERLDTSVGILSEISGEVALVLESRLANLENIRRVLHQLNPEVSIKRGYSLVTSEGAIISSTSSVKIGDSIDVRMHDGIIQAEVSDVRR